MKKKLAFGFILLERKSPMEGKAELMQNALVMFCIDNDLILLFCRKHSHLP